MAHSADSPDDSANHHLSAAETNVHYDWNNDFDPVLTVEPGETVRLECRDS